MIRSLTSHLVKLSLPTALIQLVQLLSFVIASILVGRIGPSDLAAMALGYSVYLFIIVFSIGMLFAIGIMVGHGYGANDTQIVKDYFAQGIWLAIVISIIGVLLLLFSPTYFYLTHQNPLYVEKAREFLYAFAWGLPAILLSMTLQQLMMGINKPHFINFIAILNFTLTVIAYYPLVYGHWGFPVLGLAGVGYAMSFASWASFLVLIVYCWQHKHLRTIGLSLRISSLHFKTFLYLARLGFPIGLSMALEACLLSFTVFFIGIINHPALASYQITQQLQFIPIMLPIGIGQAATVMASQYIGAKQFYKLRKTMYLVLGLSIGIMLCFCIPYFVAPHYFIRLFLGNLQFANEPALVSMATVFIMIMAVFNVFDSVRISGVGFLRGLKDVKAPLYLSIIWFWGAYIILVLIFAFWFKLGVIAVWCAVAVSFIGAGLSVWWRMENRLKKFITEN